MKEFKRTMPQDKLDAEEIMVMVDEQTGVVSLVPKTQENADYQRFLKMEAEGYEAWWHDEEIDWEQSWEKTKELPKVEEEPEAPKTKKTRRKKISEEGAE